MQVVDVANRRIVHGTDRLGTAQGAVAPQSRPAYKDWAQAQGISPCPANGTSRLIAPDAESPFPLGEVPSPEEEPELKFRTVADVPCPACGYTDTYAPELMSRRPAP